MLGAMDFTMFRPKAVYAALADHPDRPSPRTVDRWCAGAVVPAWAQQAIAERIGMPDTQRDAPPAEADGALLDDWFARWQQAAAPEWATNLAQDILNAIERDRQGFVEQAGAHYAAIAELLHGPDNDDAANPGSRGPRPDSPGPRPRRST